MTSSLPPAAPSTSAPAAPGPLPPHQPRSAGRRPRWPVVLAVAIILLPLFGLGAFAYYSWSHDPSNAKVGDCLDSITDEDAKIVGCDSSQAHYEVLAVDSSREECLQVPGTDTYHRSSCLIDLTQWGQPEQGINTVEAGDCVSIDDIDDPSPEVRKSECSTGTYPVQAVVTGVDDVPYSELEERGLPDISLSGEGRQTTDEMRSDYMTEQCQAAGADPDAWYGWNLAEAQAVYTLNQPVTSYDIVLCLGEATP